MTYNQMKMKNEFAYKIYCWNTSKSTTHNIQYTTQRNTTQHTQKGIPTYTRKCTDTDTRTHRHTRTHTNTYTYTRTDTHTPTHLHTHIHTHTPANLVAHYFPITILLSNSPFSTILPLRLALSELLFTYLQFSSLFNSM